jgi:hypothetical protein
MHKENIPIKPIPLPDYQLYRAQLCEVHHLVLPLRPVKFRPEGTLSVLPPPLKKGQTGWPWDRESAVRFTGADYSPKISVVIPSFNQGDFIEETLRSVLLQNYPCLELIIMDGASNDATHQVLDHYRDFISLAISEKDHGQSHALNKGFAVASGSLYFWLNSDDFLTMDSFNRIVPEFMDDPGLEIAYGHGLITDETGQLRFEYAPLVKDRYLRFGGIVLSHSVMWREGVHCRIWEDLQCAMDAELWLRLFPGRKSKHLYFPIGVFRKHADQKTALPAMVENWDRDFQQFIWPSYTAIDAKHWRRRKIEFRLVQRLHQFIHPYKFSRKNG